MGIIVKNAPVETHYSINMVEHYHRPLQRVYSIIITKIPGIEADLVLQMFFKAINNSIGSNKLVPILLVFDAYFRITKLDVLSLSIIQHAMALQKVIGDVQRCTTFRQVNNALNTQNGPSIWSVHDLPINSSILIY